jgi:hypothetical protein
MERPVESFEWYMDSGARHHITPHKHLLKNYRKTPKRTLYVGDNHPLPLLGMGECTIGLLHLKDVAYAPNVCLNLLSVKCLTAQGFTINFEKEVGVVLGKNKKN